MSYTYMTFIRALGVNMAAPNAINWPTDTLADLMAAMDPGTAAVLPTIIDYAEQRCYRELDLEHAEVIQVFPMTPNVQAQSFALSGAAANFGATQTQIIIPSRVNVLPTTWVSGDDQSVTGSSPCRPCSKEFLDFVFGGAGQLGQPHYFALRDDTNLLFGPTPDQAYFFRVHGRARPVPLYSAAPGNGTQTTFLSSVLPDLLLAAAMVSASGYQKNFGAQSDDPRQAVAWETQFQTLLASAKAEEIRKRFHGWMQTGESEPPPNAPGTPGPPP